MRVVCISIRTVYISIRSVYISIRAVSYSPMTLLGMRLVCIVVVGTRKNNSC